MKNKVLLSLLTALYSFVAYGQYQENGIYYTISSAFDKTAEVSRFQNTSNPDVYIQELIYCTNLNEDVISVGWKAVSGNYKTKANPSAFDGVTATNSDNTGTSTIRCTFRTQSTITFVVNATFRYDADWDGGSSSGNGNPSYNKMIVGKLDKQVGISGNELYSYDCVADDERTMAFTFTPGDEEEHYVEFRISGYFTSRYSPYTGEKYSFYKTDASIYVPAIEEGVYRVASVDKNAFKGNTSIESFDSGNEVISIGDYAFNGCTALQTITLRDNVSSLGDELFAGSALNTIISLNPIPPTATAKTFNGVDKKSTLIYVPEESLGLYQKAIGWKDFNISCYSALALEPESISLDHSSITVVEGRTEELTATILPKASIDQGISWASSDVKTATVSDGVVTAISIGEATITATTTNGKTATCVVTVIEDIEKTANEFTLMFAGILSKTTSDVSANSLEEIDAALDYYAQLSDEAQAMLSKEKQLLDELKTMAELYKNRCAAPEISIVNRQLVISCSTEGANIHYTITPIAEENTSDYEAPVDVEFEVKVTAFATIEGRMESEETIECFPISAFVPLVGDVNLDGKVSISDVPTLVDILNKQQ